MGLRDRLKNRLKSTLTGVRERVLGPRGQPVTPSTSAADAETVQPLASDWSTRPVGEVVPDPGPASESSPVVEPTPEPAPVEVAVPVAETPKPKSKKKKAEEAPPVEAQEPASTDSSTPTPGNRRRGRSKKARADESSDTPPDESPAESEAAAAAPADSDAVKERAIDALRTIFDPEIPVNIYELGLIYDVDVKPDRTVEVRMTLTSPNCPAAQSLPAEVEQKVGAVDGAVRAIVDIVWDPPWDPSRMSEAAKLELNLM